MTEDEAWLCIRAGRARRDLRTFELVLTARGIDSRIEYREGTWHLAVAAEDVWASRQELAAYERENVAAAPIPLPARIDSGRWGVVAYLAVIWLVMAFEASTAFGWDWRNVGRPAR